MADNAKPPDSSRQGLSDVQLASFGVDGLFGKYDHFIPLRPSGQDELTPSVVILYGQNGIGKTTVLRMLDGLIRLDFDVYREMPFSSSFLEFSTGQRLIVESHNDGLHVEFDNHAVVLSSQLGSKGALHAKDSKAVERFRQHFFESIENISLNYIAANRAELFGRRNSELDPSDYIANPERELLQRRLREQLRAHQTRSRALSNQVKKFISEAQLDSDAFFLNTSPDLFNEIITDLTKQDVSPPSAKEIRTILEEVHHQDESIERFGLRGDRWDYNKITSMLRSPKYSKNVHTLTVLGTYADFLSSRAQARYLIAERLLTFEEVMNEFFVDKAVTVDAASGLRISSGQARLEENQLSSGEHQLLYLMVAALTTRRRGTVIAIDEPELSIHIAWQRMLVQDLIRCASRAAPQFILATHSPDVVTAYSEHMVELKAPSGVG